MKHLITTTLVIVFVSFITLLAFAEQQIEFEVQHQNFFQEQFNNVGIKFPSIQGKNTNLHSIISDFQVNENEGGANQYSPKIATDGNGNYVVVWYDYRNGNGNIYAQKYNYSKTPIGTNFLVSDNIPNNSQIYPAVAMNKSGSFVVVWEDYRNGKGNPDIYGQLYTSNKISLQSTNFKVNEDDATFQYHPAVAMSDAGNFVVVWEDYRNKNYDIYAKIFDSTGKVIKSDFKVNDDLYTARQTLPSVAMDSAGNFVVVWEDTRNGSLEPDIYGQRFNSNGDALGKNFLVNAPVLPPQAKQYPQVAMNKSGKFVVTWRDKYYTQGYTYYNIYAQRYDVNGDTLKRNFKVNNAGSGHSYPSVAIDDSANFIIAWQNYSSDQFDIYIQKYNSNGDTIGTNLKVNDDTKNANQYSPSIVMNNLNDFFLVWYDYRNINGDIYGQKYSSTKFMQDANFKINDDKGSAYQYDSKIAVDKNGNYIVVWEDFRNGNYDIYAQRYNSNGVPIGKNFKVSHDTTNKGQYDPRVAIDGSGNFWVVWQDYREAKYAIYLQRYNSDGSPISSNYRVSSLNDYEYNPSLAVDPLGNAFVVWDASSNIYGQLFDSNGNSIGSSFKIDDATSGGQYNPWVAVNSRGYAVVAWYDYRNGSSDIYAQFFKDGDTLGANFRVDDDTTKAYQFDPKVAIDDSGDFVITWEDFRNNNYDIFAQKYDKNGNPIGTNFQVNNDYSNTSQFDPSIAMDNSGNFIISWSDQSNVEAGIDVYAQRYDNNGAIENNFKIPEVNDFDQSRSDVKLWNNRIYTTWQSNHIMGQGGDIWANILDWNQPLADKVPPTVNLLSPNGGENWLIGTEHNIEWNATDNKRVASIELYYTTGMNGYTRIDTLSQNTGIYKWIVPNIPSDNYKVKVVACDESGNRAEDISDSSFSVYATSVKDSRLNNNLPKVFELSQNYPNPFNPETVISYQLPVIGNQSSYQSPITDYQLPITNYRLPITNYHVNLSIYSITGQLIRTLVNEAQTPGYYSVKWDGRDDNGKEISSGLYIYTIKAGEFSATKRMIMIK